jgi:putative ABC transport system permease protein
MVAMMKVARGLRISTKQLVAHRGRTVLALIGIVIGVSAVIVMVGVGNGAQREVLSKIEAMGTNLVVVSAAQARPTAGRGPVRGTVTTLRIEDAAAIVHECPSIVTVAPVQSQKLAVRFGLVSANTAIVGTTVEYPQVRNIAVARGEFFTDEDNTAAARVAVIGRTVVTNLFGEEDPIGARVRIAAVPFEVVGVLEPKGNDVNGIDQDDQVVVPLRTALRRLFNVEHLGAIHFQARDQNATAAAVAQVRETLRDRHRLNRAGAPDDFTIQTQAELIETQREVSETFTTLTGSIAAVSLLVGGIGILAVMLIAVRERTREIGLRLAVGASRRDIRTQFVLEAAILGMGGGLAGIALGLVGAGVIGATTNWAMRVSWSSVLFAFAFSLAVGGFFGVYPAQRAARLDPIDALRSE